MINLFKVIVVALCVLLIYNPVSANSDYTCITLKEALKQSCDFFAEKCNGMRIVLANTVDYPKCNGRDGKRRYWNVIVNFPIEKQKNVLFIEDGIVRENTKVTWLNEPDMNINEIKIDTDYVVKKAENEFQIKPGKGNPYFYGYQFSLEKQKEMLFLCVKGFTKENKLIKVYYNPKNGMYLGSVKEN
ncbi:hypothetical protein AB1282_19840 [Gottfriedia sp. S16(2024)]|uniref:hypothetical protein n=1 Tax=Gottfriedia sp. S16(2024) TaxID=3162883 RepID=UPI003D2103B8